MPTIPREIARKAAKRWTRGEDPSASERTLGTGKTGGNQIAAARQLAGVGSQEDLARLAGVSRPTVERAEGAREALPPMRMDQMVRIVRALEAAGVEFFLPPGAPLAGGLGMRMKAR